MARLLCVDSEESETHICLGVDVANVVQVDSSEDETESLQSLFNPGGLVYMCVHVATAGRSVLLDSCRCECAGRAGLGRQRHWAIPMDKFATERAAD